jgi:predicted phosphodiesterase
MSTGESFRKTKAASNATKLPPSRLFTLLFVFLAAVGGCANITNGPVLLSVSGNRAAIMWETETEGPGKLCYGKSPIVDRCVGSTTEKAQYEATTGEGQAVKKTAFIHKVWLEDLEPGQAYKYRVGGATIFGKSYKFHATAPDANEVRFAVYGDSRSNPDIHRRLTELMKKRQVDFIVHTGDLVSRGDNYEQWGPQFFAPVRGLAETVPLYIAKGNHEGSGGNFEKLLIPSGQDNNFSFDYGPVHYLCVDNVSKDAKSEELLRLIAADAANSKAQWKFVSYHVPSLNFGGHWSDWGYPDALPTLAEAGVDFVITGHSHQYERFWPVAPPPGTNGSYVTYITAGGGGAPLYDIEPALHHAVAKRIHHFCLFHIKGNRLTMDTIDTNGNIIDHLEITKNNGQLNKQYLSTSVPTETIRLHQVLHSALTKTVPAKPRKNEPFTVSYKLSVPALNSPAKMTFRLRCGQGTYEFGEPQTFTIPAGGGTTEAKLTATPLVDVQAPVDLRGRPKPILPALWIDCHYEIGRVQEDISEPVVVHPQKD